METIIKDYWQKLKTEYEEHYQKVFFSDVSHYHQTKPFVERLQQFLTDLLVEHPADMAIVCALATVEQELRRDDEAIRLLETTISTYHQSIEDDDLARAYTNLAFYYEYQPKSYDYLMKAKSLNSPYVQTYKGLGLHHFSEYERSGSIADAESSLACFERACQIQPSDEMVYAYAVGLFTLKQYEKANTVFKELLEVYPNRMSVLLGMAYCNIYLGNKAEALGLLQQIVVGQDEVYHLGIDDIEERQIFDAYYVLEEYELFLESVHKVVDEYYWPNWDYYLYTLWITKQEEKYYRYIDKYREEILNHIEDIRGDDEYTEEEKPNSISEYEVDLANLKNIANRIEKNGDKPTVQLKLWPEFSCFLVDCIRHSF